MSGDKPTHEHFMRHALALAERGRGSTSPNPMVGCVLVKDNTIIAEGWHERAGEAHAEINALRAAGERAKGATAYVTLEPCSHYGKTPPCADALIQAGIGHVVIAMTDPNPLVNGKGIEKLKAAGIHVTHQVLEKEAQQQNQAFITRIQKKRPYVLYKTAMTLDGKIATRTGHSRWITGEAARNKVQHMRHTLDAIAVGVNTVLLDDPLLTTRLENGKTPTKIIFDSVARTPVTASLFKNDPQGNPANVIIFCTDAANHERKQALEQQGATVITLPQERKRATVTPALESLLEQGITSVLLEGGGTLAWSFFEAQAVDEVAWFIGPKLLGGGGASPLRGLGVATMDEAFTLENVQAEQIGEDLLIRAQVHYPAVLHEVEGD